MDDVHDIIERMAEKNKLSKEHREAISRGLKRHNKKKKGEGEIYILTSCYDKDDSKTNKTFKYNEFELVDAMKEIFATGIENFYSILIQRIS